MLVIGSPGIAAWIAQIGFAALLIWGWISRELAVKSAAIFLLLWGIAFIGLPRVPYGAALFPSFVAVLDIVLVLLIFNGDVRLT